MGKKKLLVQLKEEIHRRNYSRSTEKSYAQWIVRCIRFHDFTHPSDLDDTHGVKNPLDN